MDVRGPQAPLASAGRDAGRRGRSRVVQRGDGLHCDCAVEPVLRDPQVVATAHRAAGRRRQGRGHNDLHCRSRSGLRIPRRPDAAAAGGAVRPDRLPVCAVVRRDERPQDAHHRRLLGRELQDVQPRFWEAHPEHIRAPRRGYVPRAGVRRLGAGDGRARCDGAAVGLGPPAQGPGAGGDASARRDHGPRVARGVPRRQRRTGHCGDGVRGRLPAARPLRRVPALRAPPIVCAARRGAAVRGARAPARPLQGRARLTGAVHAQRRPHTERRHARGGVHHAPRSHRRVHCERRVRAAAHCASAARPARAPPARRPPRRRPRVGAVGRRALCAVRRVQRAAGRVSTGLGHVAVLARRCHNHHDARGRRVKLACDLRDVIAKYTECHK
eukprot:Opistho-1_new@85799